MVIINPSLWKEFLGSLSTKPRYTFGVPDLLALFLGKREAVSCLDNMSSVLTFVCIAIP